MSSPTAPQVEPRQSDDRPEEPAVPARKRSSRESHARNYSPGFFAKLALLAIIDALGVYVVMAAWAQDNALIAWSMVALLVVTNYVYFSKRALPMKYLLPGLAFLLVYQIFTIGYTGYIAFTNYGDGHNSTKEQAIEALLIQNEKRVEGSSAYALSVVEQGDTLGLAIVDDGEVLVGTAEEPLEAVEGAVVEGGRVVSVPDYTVLTINDIVSRQSEVANLRVPFSNDPEAGSIRTQDASNGYVYHSILEYNEKTDTMTNVQTGVVYSPNDVGQFESSDGEVLPVGWRVVVGLDNFKTAFGDSRYSEPFVKVLAWTVVFSVVSVASTFLLGLFLAVVLNDDRIKGRRILRSAMILPYAFPAFMSFLLWRGMLNTDYGFINTVLLGGADIAWLSDPILAKLAVLGVQLWVGFPYMFLICTGALQSIPADVIEAAKMDGAGITRIWKSVTMPLLLVAVAPLLISSFAFNFNNFNIIEMLTGGGPRFTDASVPVGHTDILITMVYAISGLDGGAAKNYGLASALSIVIFIIVATISVIGFRRTRSLEEIN